MDLETSTVKYETLSSNFLRLIDILISRHPLSAVSWGRTVQRNAIVGGAASSSHLSWLAVDFTADSLTDLLAASRSAIALGFSGVELDLTNQHLHVDLKERPHVWHVVKVGSQGETSLASYLTSV